MQKTKAWYSSWFDSPYYHMLYAHRNHKEASDFIVRLIDLLQPNPKATILDVACGRGRHSFEFHRHGFQVTGIDLSPKNIEYAQASRKDKDNKENIAFMVQDMRAPLDRQFSYVFNLFTSFGYFTDPNDNIRTLKAFRKQLAPNGVGVIDFLNPEWVLANLVKEESIEREGISFSIQRSTKGKWLYKDIQFQVDRQQYAFQEQVELLTVQDFISLFEQANLQLIDLFGDYQLGTYTQDQSSRQILIFQ